MSRSVMLDGFMESELSEDWRRREECGYVDARETRVRGAYIGQGSPTTIDGDRFVQDKGGSRERLSLDARWERIESGTFAL